MMSSHSSLSFRNYTTFQSNRAILGGAIYLTYETTLTFIIGFTLFTHNKADGDGGAMYALGTDIIISNDSTMNFTYNSAENGGAIYLNSAAFITFFFLLAEYLHLITMLLNMAE